VATTRRIVVLVLIGIGAVFLLFGSGALTGYLIGESGAGIKYSGLVASLERDIAEARRHSDDVGIGIATAQGAIAESTGRLADSLKLVDSLGSIPSKLRVLAQAIRDHATEIGKAVELLASVGNSINGNSGDASPGGHIPIE